MAFFRNHREKLRMLLRNGELSSFKLQNTHLQYGKNILLTLDESEDGIDYKNTIDDFLAVLFLKLLCLEG
ncbi:MAG: hypothetical protein DRH21_02055 [Deltaproteobacteria bacterium]|nr:MAG: hypothetical protein DRH21_02055 [Deltaproteobacteria bacterium]